MTKKLFSVCFVVLCLFATASFAQAQGWGEIVEAKSNLNVREKRTPKSEHVVTLAKGQRVKMDFIQDGWGAVFSLNETVRSEKRAIGYVNVKYVSILEKKMAKKKDVPSAPVKRKTAPVTVKGEGEVKAPVEATPQPDPIKVGVDPSRMPVKISSDRMTYDETGKVVSFVGNVVAEHGELTLWSEKLSAYFASKSNKQFSADSVDRIVAEGTVRVKKGTTEGTCGKLTYLVGKQLLKMEKDPLLQDGPNSLTGEIIKFHVRENRSEVVGGKGKRVKAVFMTPENMKRQ